MSSSLENLLKQVGIATSGSHVCKIFSKHQKSQEVPLDIKPTYTFVEYFRTAQKNLKSFIHVPQELLELMKKIDEAVRLHCPLGPALLANMEAMLGKEYLQTSKLDDWLQAIRIPRTEQVLLNDIEACFAPDWYSICSRKESYILDPLRTLTLLFSYITNKYALDRSSQYLTAQEIAQLSKEHKLAAWALKQAAEGKLSTPTRSELEDVKNREGQSLYYPIGYSDSSLTYLHLLAISYKEGSYTLRLLSPDASNILAKGIEYDTFCPEVIWENVELDQLCQEAFWAPLFDVATARVEEKNAFGKDHLLAFDSTHIICRISRYLKKQPVCWDVEVSGVQTQSYTKRAPDKEGPITLLPTGKVLKSPIMPHRIHKFANLLALDILKNGNSYRLFKAESRLLLLIGALESLHSNLIVPEDRGPLLRLMKLGISKIMAPLEKVFSSNPTEDELRAAKTLLATVADYLQRLSLVKANTDAIELTAAQPLYPSLVRPFCVPLDQPLDKTKQRTGVLRTLDAVLFTGANVPIQNDTLQALHDSLQDWYRVLLDAKDKIEPVELIQLAYRNIFSKIPIPETNQLKELFPEEVTAGLVVGTLLRVKEICRLVAAAMYEEPFVPPQMIVGLSAAYRFGFSLLCSIYPEAQSLPISWQALHQYLYSRHSLHLPGVERALLDKLEHSFCTLSPDGYKSPSNAFREIPLFYYSWKEINQKDFVFHREKIGALEHTFDKYSVDEVLSMNRLALRVGVQPEQTLKKWCLSFAGQAVRAMEEIAQMHVLSIYATTDAVRDTATDPSYAEHLLKTLGPEDHVHIAPISHGKIFNVFVNGFGGSWADTFCRQVLEKRPPLDLRMVKFHDATIQSSLKDLPVVLVSKFRSQADLVRSLPRSGAFQKIYFLNQAASGPSPLSIDLLLEYFEPRSNLLLNCDYRSFFRALLCSQRIFQDQIRNEPALIHRLIRFFRDMVKEGVDSSLHLERLLWISELVRYAYSFNYNLNNQLLCDIADLLKKSDSSQSRIASHLLCINHLLDGKLLDVVELASLHLMVGRAPPSDPSDYSLRLETAHAMQERAHEISAAIRDGTPDVRAKILAKILPNPEDVARTLEKRWIALDIQTLALTQEIFKKNLLDAKYLERWKKHFKQTSERHYAWREEATEKEALVVAEKIDTIAILHTNEAHNILDKIQASVGYFGSSVLLNIESSPIYINWEFGRVVGCKHFSGSHLAPHIRRTGHLELLGKAISGQVEPSEMAGCVKMKAAPDLLIHSMTGDAFIQVKGDTFQLTSDTEILPDAFQDGFSIWKNCDATSEVKAVIAAHKEDGTPLPVYFVQDGGKISSFTKPHLYLSQDAFCPEGALFSRWKIPQNELLIWLDQSNQVAEVHVPIKMDDQPYVCVVKSEKGGWKIDGLELELQETKECLEALSGYPHYLIAEDRKKTRYALLAGSWDAPEKISWSNILACGGAKCEVRELRIHKSGRLEGVSCVDNLHYMLWQCLMGQYDAAALLAKRWLIPPARAYTEQEQKELLPWIFGMGTERHPAAIALRALVVTRIIRHLKEYPPQQKEGELMPLIWRGLFGEEGDSDRQKGYLSLVEFLQRDQLLQKTMRHASFNQLVSVYDADTLIRSVGFNMTCPSQPKALVEYHEQRLGKSSSFYKGALKLDLKQEGKILEHFANRNYLHRKFDSVYVRYASYATQIEKIPLHLFKRHVAVIDLFPFFDRAYTLLKSGAKTPDEVQELAAIQSEITQLKDKRNEFCLLHFNFITDFSVYAHEGFNHLPVWMWLILQEVQKYLALGSLPDTLPELPAKSTRLGLRHAESEDVAQKFLRTLASLNGKDPETLLSDFVSEWYAEHQTQFITQDHILVETPGIYDSFLAPQSKLLVEEIEKWKTMQKEPVPTRLQTGLTHWTEEEDLKAHEARSKLELLLAVNRVTTGKELSRQFFFDQERSVDECISLALQRSPKRWKEACPHAEPEEMQRLTIQYLDAALQTKHRYTPTSDNIVLMCSEYYSHMRLREVPDQAALFKALCETEVGTIVQAIMGSGKSKKIAPCQLQEMLGRGKIPFLCVPSTLFRTTISDLQTMMWDRFKTYVRPFEFDRESCTLDRLYLIADKLKIAQDEPTVFVTRPSDLHALQLMLKERHQLIDDMRSRLKRFTILWGEDRDAFTQAILQDRWDEAKALVPESQFWYDSHIKMEEELEPYFAETDLLQAILNLLKNKASILIDEVASVFDPKNQLSFPMGWQEQANPHAARMACKLYFEWLPEFYDRLGLLENMQSLTTPEERRKVYVELCAKAWEEYRTDIDDMPDLEFFTAYLFSDAEKGQLMKEKVDSMSCGRSVLQKQYAQELCYLKYCITSGLENALTSIAFVSYGRSKQDPSLQIAIPYERANLPKENTLFRRPWKTALVTCQLYSQKWDDEQQTKQLIRLLKGIEQKEVLDAAVAIWGPQYSEEMLPSFTKQLDDARLDPKLSHHARKLICAYVQECIFPTQLKVDPSQLTSTPQDLPCIASKTDAMGGTFSFEASWHPRMLRRPDRTSDENILKALKDPRNQTCHIIPKGRADSLLELLEQKVALIDIGALMKGIPNHTVAKRLLDAVPDCDAVLFYDDARLAIMTKKEHVVLEESDHEAVRHALSKLRVSNPIAYYDHGRCIGADLELPAGKTLVTFSDSVILDDLFQGVMRCRWLLDGRHTIEYAILEEMGGEWTGDKVIKQADLQQKDKEKKANFHGICDQLRGQARAIFDSKMRMTVSRQERQKLQKQFAESFLERQSNDLVKTFNHLPKWVKAEEAIQKLVQQLIKIVPESNIEEELKKTLAFHKERGTELPKLVLEGEENEDATQEVDISKDLDRMRLMEEEYGRMLATRIPKQEIPWKNFFPKRLHAVPVGVWSDMPRPALHTLNDAVKERGFAALFFDDLLISQNLLYTFEGQPNSLLTSGQKPFHRCLLVNGAAPKLILLSEDDARQIKSFLNEGHKNKDIYLIEPSGVVNQRGDKSQSFANFWEVGPIGLRALMLQALLFQGASLALKQIPEQLLQETLAYWRALQKISKKEIRALFEAALEFRQEDLQAYRSDKTLRGLFY